MNGLKNGGLKCIVLAKTPKSNGPFVVEVMMKLQSMAKLNDNAL